MNEENMDYELPSIEEVENELFEGDEWKKEAQQIPLDEVTPTEAYLLQKYINGDPINNTERDTIKKILEKYRYAIHTIQPEKVLETYQENMEFQSSTEKFLHYSEHYNDLETITMNYPHNEDVTVEYTFDVHPLTDSQAIFDIQNNLSLFKDFTEDEMTLYTNVQAGASLTREEQVIWQGIQKKIDEIAKRDETKVMREYLAMCLTWHDEDNTRDEMLQVFNHMKPVYVALLFARVQQIQHVNDVDLERVFPDTN